MIGDFYGLRLHGLPVMVDPNAVENIYEDQKRSFKERFFSWPWKPWVTHKRVCVGTRPAAFSINDRMILCHPWIMSQLQASMKNVVIPMSFPMS